VLLDCFKLKQDNQVVLHRNAHKSMEMNQIMQSVSVAQLHVLLRPAFIVLNLLPLLERARVLLGHFVLKLTVLLPIPLPVPVALHYVPLTPASIVLNLIVRVLLGHHVLKLTVLLLIPLPVSVALHYVPLRNLYAINLVVLVLNQYHCAVK